MRMIIEENFDNVVEPYVMPENSEVTLRIVDVKEGTDKNGNPYIMPRFEVEGEVGCKEFTKFLGLPNSEMDAKKKNNALYALKQFFQAFGVDPAGGVDVESLIGLTGYAILGVSDDPQYGEQNYVRRFVIGA